MEGSLKESNYGGFSLGVFGQQKEESFSLSFPFFLIEKK
jgi:hypothetical protein